MVNEDSEEHEATLHLQAALELALTAGGKVDVHWGQFYTFLFAMTAWLSSGVSTIGVFEAQLVIIGTGVFMILNSVGLYRAYTVLDLFVDESYQLATRAHFASAKVRQFLSRGRRPMLFYFRRSVAIVAHLFGGVAIAYLARGPLVWHWSW